jgi:hypothetical protein
MGSGISGGMGSLKADQLSPNPVDKPVGELVRTVVQAAFDLELNRSD